ncbi:transglutaminase domain-containing protein [Clostridium saccharoperbutylacetonicum]|uniref:transglutaminase domain-containing protein n=1 Tax=Clostridium saccharoperbutylacetonicum TaxID=36745 RepID=UPI0039EBA300
MSHYLNAIFEFPRGCCGDASNLLAKFLRDNGIECEYVCGIKGQQSHVWLECDDYN